MIISFRVWLNRLLFLIIFAILLWIAGGGYRWLAGAVSPLAPYAKPKGEAVKAMDMQMDSPEDGGAFNRLRWFYWYGE